MMFEYNCTYMFIYKIIFKGTVEPLMFAFNLISQIKLNLISQIKLSDWACHAQEKVDRRAAVFSGDECK